MHYNCVNGMIRRDASRRPPAKNIVVSYEEELFQKVLRNCGPRTSKLPRLPFHDLVEDAVLASLPSTVRGGMVRRVGMVRGMIGRVVQYYGILRI